MKKPASSSLLKMGFLVFLFFSLFLQGCDFISDKPGNEQEAVKEVYEKYRTSMKTADISALKGLVSVRKAGELDQPDMSGKLELARALLPENVNVTGVYVKGDAATLTADADFEGGEMKGEAHFLKEDGLWRLYEEKWDVKMGAFEAPAPKQAETIELKGGEKAPSFEPIDPALLSPGLSAGPLGVEDFMTEGSPPPAKALTLGGHGDEVTALAFSADGQRLFSASYGDFTVRMWNASDGIEIASVKLDDRPTGMGVSPDGRLLIVSDAYQNITFISVDSYGLGAPERAPAGIGKIGSLSVNPNGKLFATASFDKVVTIWEIEGRLAIRAIKTPEPMRSVSFSPSGRLLAAGSSTNKLTIWDLAKGEGRTYTVSKVDKNSDISSVSFSPDGMRLATGHMDSSITIWNVANQKELHNFFVRNASTWAVGFSPDGRTLATAQSDGALHLWDANSAKRVAFLRGHSAPPRCLSFSPVGRTLATGGEDKNIILWR